MSNQSNVIIHTGAFHDVLPAGDKLAGGIIQLSADAGNVLVLGADGGLKALVPAQLPDDQVLSGDATGSVDITLTPSPDAIDPTQVNYSIRGNVKLAPAQTAGANQIQAVADTIYVAPELVGVTTAPATLGGTNIPYMAFGGKDEFLGTPVGWVLANIPGYGQAKVPYYAV